MSQLMPLADEFIVMDLESTDGTWEILQDIMGSNPKVKLARQPWPKIDAGVFADLANQLIDMCLYDNVLYYQADEIWHEDLIERMEGKFKQGNFDLSFWRIQYCNNFQQVKWFPHLVHRVGQKGSFNFTGDGMNSDRVNDARLCSGYDGGYFTQWGAMGQDGIKPYVNDMIMDVSNVGGFRDNIIAKRELHAPFWHEEPQIDLYESNGTVRRVSQSEWKQWAMNSDLWIRGNSPYNLPEIMRYHIGKTRYEVRSELIERLKNGI